MNANTNSVLVKESEANFTKTACSASVTKSHADYVLI